MKVSPEQKKFIALSSLSSGLEYYDFILFAKAISETFFIAISWLDLMALGEEFDGSAPSGGMGVGVFTYSS